ncbi:MAG: hypothetical protein V1789_05535 [PVC group bacterium]
MARVINSNSPGKRRGHLMRTVAEIQRRLLRKQAVDEDVKDMLAMVVFCLREVGVTARETADAWDERGYWKKAADFESGWEWAGETSGTIEALLREENWDALPDLLISLAGRVSGIRINALTRKETLWEGCYRKLMEHR